MNFTCKILSRNVKYRWIRFCILSWAGQSSAATRGDRWVAQEKQCIIRTGPRTGSPHATKGPHRGRSELSQAGGELRASEDLSASAFIGGQGSVHKQMVQGEFSGTVNVIRSPQRRERRRICARDLTHWCTRSPDRGVAAYLGGCWSCRKI